MDAGTCSSIADRDLASIQQKHRGRSLVEGMKVAAILGGAYPGGLETTVAPGKPQIVRVQYRRLRVHQPGSQHGHCSVHHVGKA